jgi:hypothetical protein
MKKNHINILIFKVLVFAIVFIPFYCLIITFWGLYAPSLVKKNLIYQTNTTLVPRLAEAKIYGDVDILFIGSSHAYRGFDTRIYDSAGYRSFNLGSRSQTPMQTEILLKKYLDLLTPEICIFEVSPMTFSSDGIESSIEIVTNETPSWDITKMVFSQNHIKLYNLLIFKSITYLIGNPPVPIYKFRNEDKYVPGGFTEKSLTINNFSSVFQPSESIVNIKQIESLKRILKYLNDREVKVILIQAPITSYRYDCELSNNSFDNLMNNFGEYYNFNEIIQLNDTLHFFDSHHLNQNGVVSFNARVIEMLFNTKQ